MPYTDNEKNKEVKRKYAQKKRNENKMRVEPLVEPLVELLVEPVKKKLRVISKGELRTRQILFYYKMLNDDYEYIIWVRNVKRIHKEMMACFVKLYEAKPHYKM